MENVLKVLIIREEEWKKVVEDQAEMLRLIGELKNTAPVAKPLSSFITAMEFMQAVRIGRTKFDLLVAQNKVKTIKKERKIYVPAGEVERYFKTL